MDRRFFISTLISLLKTVGITLFLYYLYVIILKFVPADTMNEINRITYFKLQNIIAMGCFTIAILLSANVNIFSNLAFIILAMRILKMFDINIVALLIGGIVALITLGICELRS